MISTSLYSTKATRRTIHVHLTSTSKIVLFVVVIYKFVTVFHELSFLTSTLLHRTPVLLLLLSTPFLHLSSLPFLVLTLLILHILFYLTSFLLFFSNSSLLISFFLFLQSLAFFLFALSFLLHSFSLLLLLKLSLLLRFFQSLLLLSLCFFFCLSVSIRLSLDSCNFFLSDFLLPSQLFLNGFTFLTL